MDRRLVFACFVAALVAGPGAAAPLTSLQQKSGYIGGQVLVALEPGMRLDVGPDGTLHNGNARLAAALARHELRTGKELGPRRARGLAANRYFQLESRRPGFDPVAAAAELQQVPGVRAASPNYRLNLFVLPNDTYRSKQWGIQHVSDSDIDLPEAWDLEKGNSSVVIGIMDNGIDLGHPDLINKIWINTQETVNQIDDDGNGLVDDVQGWDFGSGDNDPNPHALMDPIGLDVGFHGTFCAGLAAASTNNGVGISGAGWNCRLMPLKIAHPDTGLTTSAAAGAFVYAAEKGVSVLSMSFGAPDEEGLAAFFQALVDDATDAGVLCVAAVGNDSSDALFYPAACNRVLSVGGTDSTNACAWFTNFGPWVKCSAPAAWVWSSIQRNYAFDFTSQIIYILALEWDGVNPYMRGDGTSFAAPLVAGVAGLVRARYPDLTPEQVAQHIIDTGDVMPFERPIGTKVNAFRAVSELPQVAVGDRPAVALSLSGFSPNPIGSAGTTIRFTLPQAGDVDLAIYDAGGRLVRRLLSGAEMEGPQAVRWDGADQSGNAVASGVYFARLARGADVVARAGVVLR